MTTYTENQIEEIAKEAEIIAELYKKVDDILLNTKCNFLFDNYKNSENIFFVDFSIRNEFKKAQKMPLEFSQMVSVYHDWAFRNYTIAKNNQNNLHNKNIRKMIEINHYIVGTIQNIISKFQI